VNRTWSLGSFQWQGCAVMGIVNVTPDSFSDGGRYVEADAAYAHARSLLADGADVVDIGGESTRPGAAPVSADDEWRRIAPVVERLTADGDVIVSVDTRRATVARRAIEVGAHVINDVSGLRDPAMVEVCATGGVPVIVMHMQGEPATMQHDPRYDDVVAEVSQWLHQQAEMALAAGIPAVMVDPGIGFGKRLEHNLALLDAIDTLGDHGRLPVLIGASRKRMLGELYGIDQAADRDAASVEVHRQAARKGAAMVRVHDVAAHVAALRHDA
jgi:dihydropteroate synthase